MKVLLLPIVLSVMVTSFSQVRAVTECAEVTQRFITQYYSVEKQLDLVNDPEKLSKLDYICSRSFDFAPGQFVLNSQKALFVVQRYEHLREQSFRVTITDEYSGLQIVLYSWDEVGAEKQKITARYQLADNK